jgi:hypothetical protein
MKWDKRGENGVAPVTPPEKKGKKGKERGEGR